ncbi:MAG: hypothetical protein NTV01_07365 [Bacteroidia bacterium]|nr:hypothetical protein [Bacteroidia bacterium]
MNNTEYKKEIEMKTNNIKFMWNGIKVNKKLYRCWYSNGKLINHPEGTLTIYAKDYDSLPIIDELTVHNDSDFQTDYVEKDRIRVTPDNKLYTQVVAALLLADEHNRKRQAKRIR